jgi:hypothetical protein
MAGVAFNLKPDYGVPKRNRKSNLWNGCFFATMAGSIRGHIQAATPQGDRDDVTGERSTIFTAGGFTPNNVCWQRWTMGRGFDNGDGVVSQNPQGWDGAAGALFQVQNGFTASVIIRPDAQSTNGQLPFFKRRSQPYGAAQPGWCFTGAAGNFWRFNYSDGVTQRTVVSTTVQDPAGLRADMITVTLNDARTLLTIYVNGQAEAATAFAATSIGNPAGEDIKILGYGPLNEIYPGFIPFAAAWSNVLSDRSIKELYMDPWIMWRHLLDSDPIREFPPFVAKPISPVMAANVRIPLATLAAQGARIPSPVLAPHVLLAPQNAIAPAAALAAQCCNCCASGSFVSFF